MEDYSWEELLIVRDDEFPDKGPVCPICKTRIPAFQDLKPQDEAYLKELIRGGQSIEAMKRLRGVTGCNLRWAKIWVSHPHGPRPTIPCPHCGEALRTPLAQQCRFCGMDWHDPERVYRREV